MNIMYATDKNYAPICGTSLYSLLLNNQKVKEIRIFLLDDNMGREKEKFQKLVKQFSRELIIISVEKISTYFEQLNLPRFNGGYTTYLRLAICEQLPDIDKLLYLDCDTLVLENVEELYETELDGYPLGAVCDGMNANCNLALGKARRELYYNAGVMLMNFEYWRKKKLFEKIVESTHKIDLCHTATASDQELVNYVMGNEIKKLPLKYNVLVQNRIFQPLNFLYMIEKDSRTYYTLEEMRSSVQKPAILHFAGCSLERPWYANSLDPEKGRWESYLRQTPWKDYRISIVQQTMWRKACIKAYQILPEYMYCRIKKYEERIKLRKKRWIG